MLTRAFSLVLSGACFGQELPVSVRVLREPGGDRALEVVNDSPVPVRVQLMGAGHTRAVTVQPSEVLRQPVPAAAGRLAWAAAPEPKVPTAPVYRLPFIGTARVTQLPECPSSHNHGQRHAVDFAVPEGTPVRAAREGTVLTTTPGPVLAGHAPAQQIQVLHADGTWAVYGHLQDRTHLVEPGQFVQAGELLAYSGNTGVSTGPHLHFAVHYLRSGKPDTLPVVFERPLRCGMLLGQD